MKKVISYISLSLLILILSSCEKLVILHPKGHIASDEKDLILIALALMLIIVIPVIIFTLYIAWKFRVTNKNKARYSPNWCHSNILEAFVWGIPSLIVMVLAILTWVYTHRLDPYKSLDNSVKPVNSQPVNIQVIALEWRWLFIYPQQHIATINYLKIPVNRPIILSITADAPMNSLLIPQLAGQVYAMSGMRTQLHLITSHQGHYYGFSANYSGAGFADMHFVVEATSNNKFNTWVNNVKSGNFGNNTLNANTYLQLAKDTENHEVQYFSTVSDNLFHSVIMQFMGKPMLKINK